MPPLPPTEHLLTRLTQTLSLHPKSSYLQAILSSPTFLPPTTEPALLSSLRFRLTHSDFSDSLVTSLPHTLFPPDVHQNHLYQSPAPGKIFKGPLAVQVVDIWDVGESKAYQVEKLELEEAGEVRKGREVIRVIPREDQEADGGGGGGGAGARGGVGDKTPSLGPHKLLLEDAAGKRVYAFELQKVPGVEIGGKMKIGCKLVLKNIPIMRGLLMLQPSNTTILGGKIDAWDQFWSLKRKEQLIKDIALGNERE